ILGPIGALWNCDLDKWTAALANNLGGTVHCCHAAIPHLIKAGSGRIINFAGGGATSPRMNLSAYAVAKTGIVRLTETVAEELMAYHITVNAISPGLVNTRILDDLASAGAAGGAESQTIERLRRQGKVGIPAQLAADLVVFLASPEADGLTGRLISAPHDGWREWNEDRVRKIAASSWLTLRRLDFHTLDQLERSDLSS
ncbi:MAG: SDR family oxidoreductase, partial [Candidatus Binataceae bacterium]